MKKSLLMFLSIIFLISCKTTEEAKSVIAKSETEEVDPAHNSQNSLDWAGTYKGVVPCDDCDGMDITLTLRDDENYRLEILYVGKVDEPIIEDYVFTWNIRGDIVMLTNREYDIFEQFQVVENAVYLLVHNGEEVSKGDGFNQAFRLIKQ
jgi:uncharacterized lipoprotein NlpE involved in copper resistance